MIRCTTFAGRKVAIFGLARSGIATGTALVLAPGVPLTHPEPHWTVRKAQAAGIEIIGDIELFFRERAKVAPGSPVVAVTGTNGKSTTTALVAHILRAAGLDVQMGGNIGTAILLLEPPARDRYHIIEMSSFQIDLTPSLAPTAGVMLNISPDHLDRHGTLEHYAAIKARLVMAADVSFVGVDDDYSRGVEVRRLNTALPHFPVSQAAFEWGYYADGADVFFRDLGTDDAAERVASLSGIATLRGSHNAQNAAAAVGVASWFRVPADVIAGALKTFPGLPHRLEEVGRIGRALFINDSKATNADSTEKALASFPRDIFWIAGGLPKEGGIMPLASYFPRIATAYLIGQAADQFAETLEGKIPFERSGTLETAVEHAARDAAQSTGAEPVILLSPACASYDQFKSFEHRGDRFRELVRALVAQGARA
jgi:UDP-N-acetylmuramoylalanine--D-glutamate ligase